MCHSTRNYRIIPNKKNASKHKLHTDMTCNSTYKNYYIKLQDPKLKLISDRNKNSIIILL